MRHRFRFEAIGHRNLLAGAGGRWRAYLAFGVHPDLHCCANSHTEVKSRAALDYSAAAIKFQAHSKRKSAAFHGPRSGERLSCEPGYFTGLEKLVSPSSTSANAQ